MNRKLFTMLAVGFTVCSAGPVWAVYNPLVIGGTVAAPVTMTPQGFSSTTVSVANETHVEDAPDATNMSTWGGMQMINPDIESYAGTDTHNSSTGAVMTSAGSGSTFSSASTLVIAPSTAEPYDQSGGDINIGIAGTSTGAWSMDGWSDSAASGQLFATKSSSINVATSNNVTGTAQVDGGSYAADGNTATWTGNYGDVTESNIPDYITQQDDPQLLELFKDYATAWAANDTSTMVPTQEDLYDYIHGEYGTDGLYNIFNPAWNFVHYDVANTDYVPVEESYNHPGIEYYMDE